MLWGNQTFAGMVPRIPARQLPEPAAQAAINCWLDRREPRPVPELRAVAGVGAFSPIVKSIFRFDANRWFAWNDDVDVVRAPIQQDTLLRTIWTGDDYPRHTTTTIMQGGGFVGPGVPLSRRLGIPAPTQTPTVALTGTVTRKFALRQGNLTLKAQNADASIVLAAASGGEGPYTYAIVPEVSPISFDEATRTLTVAAGHQGTTTLTYGARERGTGEHINVQFTLTYDTRAESTGDSSAAPTDTPLTALGDEEESHAWVYTFLSDLDEEGPPSEASTVLDRPFNADGTPQTVTITLPTALQGAYGVNRKRIYRTATGASGVTTYRLVATIPLSQATYDDSTKTADLGEALISTDWDPPPAGLKGLISLPNGVLAGYLDRDVYFSEPYQPHAWPEAYIQSLDFDVVGLGNFGTTVIVGTKGTPYLISGSHPEQAGASKMEFNQACIAKRSFAFVDEQGVVFASPDGLVLVGPGGGRMASKAHYDRADWQALNPAEFRTVYHDGAFVAFSNTKAVAFDPDMEGVVEIEDAGIKAVYQDRENDKIFVVDSDRMLKEWKTDETAGDTMRTMRWRSKRHVGAARTFSAAQVIAEAYPVTFRLFGDDMIRTTKTVQSSAPFRLPEMGLRARWEYEVEGQHAVKAVRVGAMHEMEG